MKTIHALKGILVAVCLVVLMCCDGPDYGPVYVRVKSFTWDGTLYKAQYDGLGKLTKLKAAGSDIIFSYDESGKLYKATTRNTGEPVPLYVYEFTHGIWGINKILRHSRLSDGLLHLDYIQKMNYLSATKLTSLIQQEVTDDGDTITVGFEQDRKFTYTGNNVSRIYVEPAFNEYTASAYDAKVNPFMMMAASVGNPAFFPVGRFVNFPVVDFNIPLVSIFSCNNPVKAKYEIVGAPITTSNQTFVNTYSVEGLVTKIVWTSASSPTDSRTFKFDYETARRR